MGDVKKETGRQTNAELVVQLRSIVDRQGEVAVVLVQRELFNRAIGRIAETLRQPDTSEGGGEAFAYTTPSIVEGFSDPKTIVGSIWPTHVAGKYATVPLYLAPPLKKSPNPEHVEGDVLSVGEMAFDGVAKRKLEGLIERGWKISGYSLYQDGDHGLITTGGFVGWFSVAERNDAAARASLATAEAQLADAVKVLEQSKALLREFLAHNDEGPGLIDCIDNDGERYTSQGLDNTVKATRAFLASLGEKQDAE